MNKTYIVFVFIILCAACLQQSSYDHVDISGSSMTISNAILLANGTDVAHITFIAKQSNAKPIVGMGVSFQTTNCNIMQTNMATDTNGNVSADIVSTTPGTYTVYANITDGSFKQKASVSVDVQFLQNTQATTSKAGVPMDVQFLARDANGKLIPDYQGEVYFIATDAQATLPTNQTFALQDHGYRQLGDALTWRTSGVQVLQGFDMLTHTLVFSATTTVASSEAFSYVITSNTNNQAIAGNNFIYTLSVDDAFGNQAVNYVGTVHVLSSTDNNAVLPKNYQFTTEDAGAHTFTSGMVFKTTGLQTFFVEDTSNPSLFATSHSIDVLPAKLSAFQLNPTIAIVDQNTTLTLIAVDEFGNMATNYTGTLQISCNATQATCPSYLVFNANSAGTVTFPVLFHTVGAQPVEITATNAAYHIDATIHVVAGPVSSIAVQANTTIVSGVPTVFTIEPQDAHGNTVADYLGVLQITSSDANAHVSTILCDFTSVDAGICYLVVTFATFGVQSVTAEDVVSHLSGTLDVNVTAPYNQTSLRFVNIPTQVTAGVPFELIVQEVNVYGNVISNNQDLIYIASSDISAVLPTQSVWSASGQGNIILYQAGNTNIIVTDASNTDVQSALASIQVTAAEANHLVFLVDVQNPTACSVFNPSVQVIAEDTFGNQATLLVPVEMSLVKPSATNALLQGTRTQSPNQNVAVFDDLLINIYDSNIYQLKASATGFTPVLGAQFLIAADTVAATFNAINGNQGSIDVSYTVSAACPLDIVLSYDSNFPATSLSNSDYRFHLDAKNALTQQFFWNSTRDISRSSQASVHLHLSAISAGGSATRTQSLAVYNALRLSQATTYIGSHNIYATALGDLNHDGSLDMVAISTNNNQIDIRLGTNGIFASAQSYPAGVSPVALLIRDFNQDGNLDILVANQNNGTVAFLRGDGNGNVALPQYSSVGANPVAFATADLNHDGILDIVVVNAEPNNTITWLIGDGTGLFNTQGTAATGNAPRAIALADLNTDGLPDAVVTNFSDATVIVFLSSNGNLFSNIQTLATPAGPLSVALSDIDTNGSIDIIVSNNMGFSTLINPNNLGIFSAYHFVSLNFTPQYLAVSDLNQDGKPDIVASNINQNTIVYFNNTSTMLQFATGGFGYFALDDINHDSLPDIVGVNQSNATMVVLNNMPLSAQGSLSMASSLPTNTDFSSAAMADFNEDGLLDVLAVSSEADLVALYIRDAAGALVLQHNITVGAAPVAITIGDFNGDGHVDAAIANSISSVLSILLGDGLGNFAQYHTGYIGAGLSDIYAADFNNDGFLDLATVATLDSTIIISMGDGNGYFANPIAYSVGSLGPVACAVADINHDGALDIVTRNAASGTVSSMLGSPNALGSFAAAYVSTMPCISNNTPSAICLAPILGNSNIDMALSCNGNIYICPGGNNGHFLTCASITNVASYDDNLFVADINQDGALDMVWTSVIDTYNMGATIAFNQGTNANWLLKQAFTDGLPLGIADFNQDGLPDILAGSTASRLDIFLNRGMSHFSTSPITFANTSPTNACFTDFNHDGFIDVAVAGGNAIYLFQGDTNATGQFSWLASYHMAANANAVGIAVGDINHDGFIDVVATDSNNSHMYTWLGVSNMQPLSNSPNVLSVAAPGLLQLFDINQDGALDAVVISNNQLVYFAGNGTGGFASTANTLIAQAIADFVIGDIDNNGTPNIAATTTGGNVVTTYNGSITQAVYLSHPVANSPILLADINQDGKLDLIIGSNGISVCLGEGNGSFATCQNFLTGNILKSMALIDINHDGITDIVASIASGPMLQALGNGAGAFTSVTYQAGFAPTYGAIYTHDINNDGLTDVVMLQPGLNYLMSFLGEF